MITGLAARREAVTQWAGKEAGAWVGTWTVGCWSPPSAQDVLGRLGLEAQGEGGLPVPSWWAVGVWGMLILESQAIILESGSYRRAECQSRKKPDAACCSASSASVPASWAAPLCWALCSAHSHLIFTTTLGCGYSCLHFNRKKHISRDGKGLAQGHPVIWHYHSMGGPKPPI